MTTGLTKDISDIYENIVNFDQPLGTKRQMLFVPAGATQEIINKSGKWAQWGGYLIPDEYTHWYDEITALRNTAVLGDWSPLWKYIVEGSDASRFVNYIGTRNLSNIKIGQAMYNAYVNENGKMLMDALITRMGEDSYRLTNCNLTKWAEHIRSLKGFDVQIKDIRGETCLYSLQGPNSRDILEEASGEDWEDTPFSRLRNCTIGGVSVDIVRQGFTGELGYELITDVASANNLYSALIRIGENHGMLCLGNYASRLARMEAGLFLMYYDFYPAGPDEPGLRRHMQLKKSDHLVSPSELGLDYIVDLDRDDFMGKQALVAEKNAGGPSRKAVGLVWNSDNVTSVFAAQLHDEPAPPPIRFPHLTNPEAQRIVNNGNHVGWATSVSYSPNIRRVISFARMEKELTEPGTEVIVEWGGGNHPVIEIRAEVVKLPFVSRKRSSD